MTITPSVGGSLLQPVMAARNTIAAHSINVFFIICLCLLFPCNLLFHSCNFTAHICGVDFRGENRSRIYAGSTFRVKIDRAYMRSALSGRKPASHRCGVRLPGRFVPPHICAVCFHASAGSASGCGSVSELSFFFLLALGFDIACLRKYSRSSLTRATSFCALSTPGLRRA